MGVILSWNTISADAGDNLFTVPGGYVINPVSWTADDAPAEAADVLGKGYYYVSEKEPAGTFNPSLLGGVRADPERGALIVDLPVRSQYDANGFMGAGVFHMNDIWFFAGNLRDNAVRRVLKWYEKFPAGRK